MGYYAALLIFSTVSIFSVLLEFGRKLSKLGIPEDAIAYSPPCSCPLGNIVISKVQKKHFGSAAGDGSGINYCSYMMGQEKQ